MNNLEIFENKEFGQIRILTDENSEPWFVGKDVAEALGYTNSRKAIVDHVDDDDKGVTKCDTLGGEQNFTIINESGLYSLVLSSKLESAKKFKRWVTSEVLPSIRKHGGYMASKAEETPEELMARALAVAKITLEKKEERLKQLEQSNEMQQETINLQTKELKQAAPKVEYYERHLQSVDTMTTTQVAKSIGMEAVKLNCKLKEIGVIFRQSGQWLLHAPFSSWGMHATRMQTYTRSDGRISSRIYTVWNNRGVRFIIALYENDWNVNRAVKEIMM